MHAGDLVAKMKFAGYFYKDRDYFKKYYKKDLVKIGIILECSDSNKHRFGNENLWFLIMWGDGKMNWVSNNNLLVINEDR